jgi:predicted transposase/invertase (TIGR01784 family)
MTKIYNPHDKLFKQSLNNLEIAKEFLKIHLPKEIFKFIKSNTLSICPNSYITPELEETSSDVLYKAKSVNNKEFYIYTLIEHQSTAVWNMPLRILNYQLSIINSHLEQHPEQKKIPIVVPLLVYNGKISPYPYSLNIFDLFNNVKLAKKTLAKPAHLIDLTVMDDQEIKQHNLIGLLEFSQKHVRDRKFLKQAIENLVYIINKLDQDVNQKQLIGDDVWFINYVQSNLHYVYYFANILNEQEFTEKLETIDFVKRENIMGAMARKIEQQGIEQGIERGVDQNKKETARIMLAEGADLNFIVKVTKLTVEEINKLKE